jgi:hypothetical protein
MIIVAVSMGHQERQVAQIVTAVLNRTGL